MPNAVANSKKILSSVFALTMALVAGHVKAATLQPLPAKQSEATIYIFRPASLFNAGNGSSFYIDGLRVAKIGSGGCTALHAPPGEHKFEQGWDLLFLSDKQIEIDVSWVAGKTYFYELDIGGGFAPTGAGVSVTKDSAVREVNLGENKDWMDKCRYAPPLNAEKLAAKYRSAEGDGPDPLSSPVASDAK